MKYEYGFTIDFDKIQNDDVSKALGLLCGWEKLDSEVSDYIWWNPLGNYISWIDGCNCSFYFCRTYVRIKGLDLTNKIDREKCFEFLSTFKQLN